MTIRIVIVEDHPLVAQGLAALLQDGGKVVDIVLHPDQVLHSIQRYQPDLVLLDLSMPGKNGLELLPEIRRVKPDVKVLVVTMHFDRTIAEMAFAAGANGFIPKEGSADELWKAITRVMKGKRYLSGRVGKRRYRSADVLEDQALERLTPRQRQILERVAAGMPSTQIATELGVSTKTIEYHRASMRKALGISSEWGLMRYAIVAGLGRGKRTVSR